MTPDELARLAVVEAEVLHIKSQLDRIEQNTAQLAAQANRWKGAIVVLLAAGGFLGWAIDHLLKLGGK